ncbi:hypothetical protein, partial [Thiolapillus sp.]|uniref:hypothetical protein n=2 Tax=Thiolapillus sp. TaxID=2017437 RepID=UPI003AF7296F
LFIASGAIFVSGALGFEMLGGWYADRYGEVSVAYAMLYTCQACLRPRDRFWDIPVPKIDSAFDNLFVPQTSWSPSTTQQLRKLVAAPYLSPNDWTPRSEAYFVFPLAQGTPGKQCGLAATGVYQPSLRSPWLAAEETLEMTGISLFIYSLLKYIAQRFDNLRLAFYDE